MAITIGLGAIFLAFYLYLLIRKEAVARPLFLWIGLGGLALVIAAHSLLLLSQHRAMIIICGLLNLIGLLAALAGAVGTCYGGELPFSMAGEAPQAPPQPPVEQPPAQSGGNIDMSS